MATPENFYIPEAEFAKIEKDRGKKGKYGAISPESLEKWDPTLEENKELGKIGHKGKGMPEVKVEDVPVSDLEMGKRVQSGEFDTEKFKKYQLEVIGSKNPKRIALMRALTKKAEEVLEQKNK